MSIIDKGRIKFPSKMPRHYSIVLFKILLISFSLLRVSKTALYIPDYDLSSTPLDPIKTGFTLSGSINDDNVGFSVSTAGDINGDGYADVIIGAYGKKNFKGEAYVIYGKPNFSSSYADLDLSMLDPKTTGFTITGEVDDDSFGYSVRWAGNINNDEYDDIIIGAPMKDSNRGMVYVIYGRPTSEMENIDLAMTMLDPAKTGFYIVGEADDDHFGWIASTAGDVDNDGFDDIIVGAPHKDLNQGAVYVIYGAENSQMSNLKLSIMTLDPLTTGFKITGEVADDLFGVSVSRAGNLNGDSYADIIIGASGKDLSQGAAYVIYGRDRSSLGNTELAFVTLDPTLTGFMVIGSAASDQLGLSVDTIGDIDQDGYDDVIIGAYGQNAGSGAIYVIYGKESSELADIDLTRGILDPETTGFIISDSANTDNIGYSVRGAGDVNGDGYPDILVGADAKFSYHGGVYVIYGGPEMDNIDFSMVSLDPETTGFVIIGNNGGDFFGNAVNMAGDVNGDGYDDLVIGAYTKNANQGAAYVIYSSRYFLFGGLNYFFRLCE